MENKSHAFAAGIFVLVVTALVIGLAVWLTRDSGSYQTYELSSREGVSGLQPQAAVRYKGVAVGKVTRIGFDPQVNGNVLIRIAVNEQAPISPTTFAVLGYQGVTGLAFVQLDDDGKTGPPLPPDDDAPPRIPLKPSLFGKLAQRSEVIIEQVEKITTQMNKLLADDNQQRVAAALDNVGQASASVGQLAQRLDTTVAQRLDPALASIPPFTAEATKTMRSLQATSDQVGKASSEIGKTAQLAFVDQDFRRTREFTDQILSAMRSEFGGHAEKK